MVKRSAVEKAKTATMSKVTVSRRQIHRFLGLAAGIVPARPAIPVLGNVLLVVKSGKLRMRATNLDLELCAVCDVDGNADFSAAAPDEVLAIFRDLSQPESSRVREQAASHGVHTKVGIESVNAPISRLCSSSNAAFHCYQSDTSA